MRVVLIGAEGFVGGAFRRFLEREQGIELTAVTRQNYAQHAGKSFDLVIEAACNSKKFLADERPVEEFDSSVLHRLKSLHDFTAPMHLHLSSVDVYSDLTTPEGTREDAKIQLSNCSHYGVHKLLAEQLVQHYASRWLIVRLAGMVGQGLRKNPVFDILNNKPLRIHPDSQYQFMHTAEVAAQVWRLVQEDVQGEVYNVCGEGLISPKEIAALAGRELDLTLLSGDARPRVVNASTEKLRQRGPVPSTREAVKRYLSEQAAIA